jgi:hypothetical protein
MSAIERQNFFSFFEKEEERKCIGLAIVSESRTMWNDEADRDGFGPYKPISPTDFANLLKRFPKQIIYDSESNVIRVQHGNGNLELQLANLSWVPPFPAIKSDLKPLTQRANEEAQQMKIGECISLFVRGEGDSSIYIGFTSHNHFYPQAPNDHREYSDEMKWINMPFVYRLTDGIYTDDRNVYQVVHEQVVRQSGFIPECWLFALYTGALRILSVCKFSRIRCDKVQVPTKFACAEDDIFGVVIIRDRYRFINIRLNRNQFGMTVREPVHGTTETRICTIAECNIYTIDHSGHECLFTDKSACRHIVSCNHYVNNFFICQSLTSGEILSDEGICKDGIIHETLRGAGNKIFWPAQHTHPMSQSENRYDCCGLDAKTLLSNLESYVAKALANMILSFLDFNTLNTGTLLQKFDLETVLSVLRESWNDPTKQQSTILNLLTFAHLRGSAHIKM